MTTYCDGPQRLPIYQKYFPYTWTDRKTSEKTWDASGYCETAGVGVEALCPEGWKFVDDVSTGCRLTYHTALCEKTTWSKEPWKCCLQNDGTDSECKPNLCKKKQLNDDCRDALMQHCIAGNNWKNLSTIECRDWARRPEVAKEQKVFDGVKKYCNQPAHARDAFCSCINSYRPELCANDECFARRNPAAIDLAYCASTECKNPKPGAFLPKIDCASKICAPVVEFGGQITVGESITLQKLCNFSDEDMKALKGHIVGTDVATIGKEGGDSGEGGGEGEGGDGGGDGGGGTPNPPEAKKGSMMWLLYAGIAVFAILLIVALVLLLSRKSSQPMVAAYAPMTPYPQAQPSFMSPQPSFMSPAPAAAASSSYSPIFPQSPYY